MNSFVLGLKDWVKDFFKALVFFLFLQTFVVQGFVIEGACMEPELESREKIMVNKFIYNFREPHVGEVVVFEYPLDPNKDFVKRVVGVPGDKIEIKNGFLYRNDVRVREDYVPEYIFGRYGPKVVPQDKLCVMGDNRNSSHDSRSWGLLERSKLKGRAEFRFWPLNNFGVVQTFND